MTVSEDLSDLYHIFDRPLFIVAAPRSGSTMLFELLQGHAALWTIGGEGHAHVESVEGLSIVDREPPSNRLTQTDFAPPRARSLLANYLADLRDNSGQRYESLQDLREPVRFLEKTPKNALRIPFFKQIFPAARFIWLVRRPHANISSIIEAWRSGRFVTYPHLPGWHTLRWSLVLIEEWEALADAPLAKVACAQWDSVNQTILSDLYRLSREQWMAVSYDDLLDDRPATLRRIFDFAELDPAGMPEAAASGDLRNSRYTLTPPDRDKWRRNEGEMTPHITSAMETMAAIEKATL